MNPLIPISALLFLAISTVAKTPSPEIIMPDMVLIPAGAFTMGQDGGEEGRYEGPPHTVTVARPFLLGKTEVTHGQFKAFVEASGFTPEPGCMVWPKGTLAFDEASWDNPGYATQDDYPAACISWTAAQAYIDWLNGVSGETYRLPTEAEWEYAASSGAQTAYPWGDAIEHGCAYANWYDAGSKGMFPWAHTACNDGHAGPSPVASYPPNAFGVHDMIGNVWEWVADCYSTPYPVAHTTQAAHQAQGPCDRRSVRGGSWMTRASRNTVHFRGRDPEDTRYFMFGFRLAKDVTS